MNIYAKFNFHEPKLKGGRKKKKKKSTLLNFPHFVENLDRLST